MAEDTPNPKPPESPLSTPVAWDIVAPGYTAINLPHFTSYAEDALRFAKLQPEYDVIDIATGPGTLALLASPRVRRVEAIDFAPKMLEELNGLATAQGATNIFVHQADGQALPYPDKSFHAAFSMFGLMFFPDRARGFREMRRVLKPGAMAVVSSWQPVERVPFLVTLFDALAEAASAPPRNSKGPLSEPSEFQAEMSSAGFHVEVHEVAHAVDAPSLAEFWAGMRQSLAPLALLERRLGPAAFRPVGERIFERLKSAFGEGPVHVEMPAWLGVGRAH